MVSSFGLTKLVFSPSKLGWMVIVAVVLALIIIPSFYFYSQYRKTQALLQSSNTSRVSESKMITEAVGKLIELPVGEDPTIATVSDITKLSDQQFFSKAKNGDKVLVYKKAKELILYRPSVNKIINIATLNTVNVPQESQTIQPTPTATPVATANPVMIPIQ